ncbi:triose-phosphate isomerase [Lutibaculum baratangense]|uniref:Triosephosphate isomerase n=1 Tax=Lutibaculum baratangense AMV1 TaxID=631454 RepID=V4RJS7_9HYPH|nr:triose-phosphate isomerase [Lutibaculum baratangense]ESR23495.1 Triosephosphate isomerase [Lutibaculum baratangense AMV1]
MTPGVRPLVAGNWKMNGLRGSEREFEAMLERARADRGADLMICPPATLLMRLSAIAGNGPIALGGQDCHAEVSGAHTGDLSAEMLADAGATAVILGHSERRQDHGETSAQVAAKVEAAWRAGLTAIVCVGETEAERDEGRAVEVVLGQLQGSVPEGATHETLVVAYEPVWAIGTGRTPTAEDVREMHSRQREGLKARFGKAGEAIRILYGGSVKPANAAELMAIANVDGALVGGASLKADDFMGIAAAYETLSG